MLEIKLDKQPEKFLKKCEKVLCERIISKIEELKSNPVPHNSKRIAGSCTLMFRIRIGKYRVLYEVDYKDQMIGIIKIEHREKV